MSRGGFRISGLVSSLIFILLVALYLLVIEVFYIIFRFTGLNREKARFQTVSLLTNAGFTTSESEDIANSRIRRKVAMVAMMFGYMFSVVIASSIVNMVIGFVGQNKASNLTNIAIIVIAILIIFLITKSERLTNFISHLIKGRVEKYIEKTQQANPLYVLDNYGTSVVCEVLITKVPEDIKDKTLIEAEVRQKYDVSVLTLKRGNEARTMEASTDKFQRGDRVVVFGNLENIKVLFHSDIL